jgi:hypothetical protein
MVICITVTGAKTLVRPLTSGYRRHTRSLRSPHHNLPQSERVFDHRHQHQASLGRGQLVKPARHVNEHQLQLVGWRSAGKREQR